MKTVDHSYEQALIMHDNVHIHVIMNIIMTPTPRCLLAVSRVVSLVSQKQGVQGLSLIHI